MRQKIMVFAFLLFVTVIFVIAIEEGVTTARDMRARKIAKEQISKALTTGIIIVGKDPWNNDFRFLETKTESNIERVTSSAGQDGKWNTGDDIIGRKRSYVSVTIREN